MIRISEKKRRFHEADVPAIAKAAGTLVSPKITGVVRQDSIYDTCLAMGLKTKINAMKNVVCEVPDMQTAGAVLQTIYNQFGVKGSFMLTWTGSGKLYWDPKTPVDTNVALSSARARGLPPPRSNPKHYIGY